jgi:hypothetical protein
VSRAASRKLQNKVGAAAAASGGRIPRLRRRRGRKQVRRPDHDEAGCHTQNGHETRAGGQLRTSHRGRLRKRARQQWRRHRYSPRPPWSRSPHRAPAREALGSWRPSSTNAPPHTSNRGTARQRAANPYPHRRLCKPRLRQQPLPVPRALASALLLHPDASGDDAPIL